jgi:hypothetical protein
MVDSGIRQTGRPARAALRNGSLARPKPQQGLDGSRRPPHHRTKITSTESRLLGKVSASAGFGMADYPPGSVPRTCLEGLPSRGDTCIALPQRYIESEDFEQRLESPRPYPHTTA